MSDIRSRLGSPRRDVQNNTNDHVFRFDIFTVVFSVIKARQRRMLVAAALVVQDLGCSGPDGVKK